MDLITKLILLLKYAFLGLVQGFTEPLPISSSGHIVLIRHLFSVNIEGLSFEIIVNFGSLIAVTLVYRHDILRLIKNSLSFVLIRDRTNQADFKFCVLLMIATRTRGSIGILFVVFISSKVSLCTVASMNLVI